MTTNVNVGITPNDGTGDTLRDAFIKTNQNFIEVTQFIADPSFFNASVNGTLTAATVQADNVTIGNVLTLTSPTISVSPTTGTLVCAGGAGFGGNVYITDTFHGNVSALNTNSINLTSNVAITQELGVSHNASIAGNIAVGGDATINGSLTVFGALTTITTSNLVIKDPQIEIGKPDVGPLSYNDGVDRGLLAYWFDGTTSAEKISFFGVDTATGNFTYEVEANVTGNAKFNTVAANIASTGFSTFNVINADAVIATAGFTGNVITAAQPNITSLGTLTGLGVAGNISVTGGMVYINGSPVVTSDTAFQGGSVLLPTNFLSTNNAADTTPALATAGGAVITKDLIVGGTATLGDLVVTAPFEGVIATADQPNITSLGTLGNLAVSNNISTGSLSTGSVTTGGTVSAGTVVASVGIQGTLTTGNQPNITTVGNLSALTVTGTITGAFNGTVGATTPSTGAFTTLSASAGITGTLQSNAQPNVTSVGTLTDLSVAGATTVGSLNAGAGSIATTGNVSATSVSATTLAGTLQTAAQPNVTSLGTLSGLNVSGVTNVGQNILPTAPSLNIGSSGSRFGTIYATTINASGSIAGNVMQANHIEGPIGTLVPDVATFTDVTVSGTLTAAGFASSGSSFTNPVITGGSIDNTTVGLTTPAAGKFTSLESTLGITGTLLSPSQTAITEVGTLTNLTVTNTINGTASTVVTNANMMGDVTSIGNNTTIGANKVTNAKMATMGANTIKGNNSAGATNPIDLTPAQVTAMLPLATNALKGLAPNLSGVSTQFLAGDGTWQYPPNTYVHPAYTAANVSTTGANVISSVAYDAIGSIANITTRDITLSDLGYTGATNANYITATSQIINDSGFITSSASITGSAATVTGATQSAITSVGSLTSLAVIGNSTLGNLLVNGSLTVNGTTTTLNTATLDVTDLNITVAKGAANPTAAHGAGLTVDGAGATLTYVSSTDRWSMNKNLTVPFVYGTATSAQYADLAEKYQTDAQYEPGTVLVFGGSREVTTTGSYADPSVAGVVSTAPAYLMNADEPHSVAVALRGKVPVKVVGPVRKGDLLVTSYVAGHAESVGKETKYGVSVFAKSIQEDLAPGQKVIMAVII